MALNLISLRSVLKSRSSVSVLLNFKSKQRNFSDDPSKKSKHPDEKNNLYDTLGVSSAATQREIKKAYYDLTLKYHPDRNENCEDSATKFREVAEAYEILGSYALRKKYDKGVPVSVMKKSRAPVAVDHRVQFQEFYDSRSSQGSFSDHSTDFDNVADSSRKESYVENTLKKEKDNRPTFGVQVAIIVFFMILVYMSKQRYANDKHMPKS